MTKTYLRCVLKHILLNSNNSCYRNFSKPLG